MRITGLARHLIAVLVAGLSAVAAATDPAVIHANRVGSRAYTEGFIGKGDDRILDAKDNGSQ